MAKKGSTTALVSDLICKTKRSYISEEKIRVKIEGLRGETSIAELCRKEVHRGRKKSRRLNI